MPKLISKLEVGNNESAYTTTMLATIMKDRRDVYMLTTRYENKIIAFTGKKDYQGNQVETSVLK